MQFQYLTDRLILKVLSAQDAPMVYQFYLQNQNFLEPFEPARPNNFYSESFHYSNLSYEYRGFLNMSYLRYWLFTKENPDTPIGTFCFSNIIRGAFQKCTLGYKLGKSYCHLGYMQEAISYIIPHVFKDLKLHRIEAYVQPENQPSVNLLSRLGFKEEGYLASYAQICGEWKDHLVFSLIFPFNSNSQ